MLSSKGEQAETQVVAGSGHLDRCSDVAGMDLDSRGQLRSDSDNAYSSSGWNYFLVVPALVVACFRSKLENEIPRIICFVLGWSGGFGLLAL